MNTRRLSAKLLVAVLAVAALLAAVPIANTFSAFSATTSARATFAAQAVFVPEDTTAPTFSGTAQAGQQLTGAVGSWSRSPSSYKYQWQRCPADGQGSCTAISSATASVYTVASADAGYRLRLAVTAHNAGGDSAPATSAPSTVIPPVLQAAPAISGLPAIGQPLTVSTGTWLGVGAAYTYQWRRCDLRGATCTDISGATGSIYTPTSTDRHATVLASVTASEPSGPATSASTPPTNPIADSVNPIVTENQQPGTTAWKIKGSPSTSIVGYASEISVQPGDVLHMHVSSNGNANYRVEIYRLGWYGGAGGRLITCIPSCLGDEPGTQYPVPSPDPSTGYLDAGWPVTDSTTVGADWTSGYYLAKLVLTSGASIGAASYIPFIVKSPPATSSALLVQASVNTWEAYNNWGGKSLYTSNSTNAIAATMVSFNRPFSAVPYNSSPLSFEYPLVRFLERFGYDVSYQTDVDTDEAASSLTSHHLNIVSGHDEYWSKGMRDAFEAARNGGINLAFVGGNIGYWQARYSDSDRTLIEYRSASADPDTDPAQKTTTFQALSRPECQLLGVQFQNGQEPSTNAAGDFAIQPAASSSSWFQGTGLSSGDTLSGAVGYEWDAIQPGCSVPPLTDLMHAEGLPTMSGAPATADAVSYQASSGARVFSDGTLNLTYALDNYGQSNSTDPRVQLVFANAFDDLSGSR